MIFNINDAFSWIGVIISVFFFSLPFKQYKKLCIGQLKFNETPNILVLGNYLNSIVWIIYGFKIKNVQLQICYIIGSIFSLICTLTYFIFLGKIKTCKAFLYSVCLAAITFILGFLFILLIDNVDIIGICCIILSTVTCVDPIKLIIKVLKTKNYKLIPMYLVLISLIGTTSWIIYGFMEVNFNIIIANFIRMVLQFVHLFMWRIFKKKKTVRGTNDSNRSYTAHAVVSTKGLQSRNVTID